MPPSKKHESDTDEDYEDVESINSDSSASVHTSDEEDDEVEAPQAKNEDDAESGDEIAAAATITPTKTLYYRYISSDPIPGGSDKFKPVRVGNLHIGTPEATDQLPDHHKYYSVLQTQEGEYVSALRYRKDPAATIEEYYFFSNQTTWQAQTRRLLKGCKMGMPVLANLSLYVHNMTDGQECDKTLLESDDLANYCKDHLLDTQHAKKIIAKAAKAAAAKLEKKRAAAAAKELEASKKRKTQDTNEEGDAAEPAQPPKKKRPKKKASELTPKIVEEDDDASPAASPAKPGTTPDKPPAVKPKLVKSRQLQLSDQLKAASPRRSKSPSAAKAKAKKKLVLKSAVQAFESTIPKFQALMDALGVYAVHE